MKSLTILFLFLNAALFGQRSDFGEISFKKADSIAFQYKGESLKNLPLLTYKLTAALPTDVEKFRAIYTWVCTNIENDYGSYIKTRKKRKKLFKKQEALMEWNNSFTPQVFENLLKHRKTACTGYAYLTRELASLADIKCEIVNGYGRTATLVLDENSIPNHSWNAVELNGNWYLCDPTWSAGRIVLEQDGPGFQAEYYDGYFLADPRLFVKNHYPLLVDWTLLPEIPTFGEFLDGPIIYKEAFTATIIPIAPAKRQFRAIKNEPVSFSFTLPDMIEVEDISLVLNKGGSDKNIRPEFTVDQKTYSLKHRFDAVGKYDVHIKLNEVIVTTYVVLVSRK